MPLFLSAMCAMVVVCAVVVVCAAVVVGKFLHFLEHVNLQLFGSKNKYHLGLAVHLHLNKKQLLHYKFYNH